MNVRILGALASRLGRRVILLFVLSAMVPLLAIAVYSWTQVTEQLQDEAYRRLRFTVKSIAMTTMERLMVVEGDLQTYASLLAGESSRTDGVAGPLENRLAERFEGLVVIDASTGKRIGHAVSALEDLPQLDERDLGRLAESAAAVKILSDGEDDRAPRVFLVVRAPTDSGHILVFAKVRPAYLWGGEALIPPDTDLIVLGPGGQLLLSSSDESAPLAKLRSAVAKSSHSGRLDWEQGDNVFVGVYWSLFAKERFDTSWVFAHGQPAADVFGTLHRFRWFFALVVALAVGIAAFLSLSQIRRVLEPVLQLDAATRRVSGGDLTVELDIRSGDEFEDLSMTFNDMVRRLLANIKTRERVELELIESRDAAIEAAKRETEFVQSVSHELRTPMTSIRACSEILRDHGQDDPEASAEFLEILVTESERLTRLIDQILDFSRLHTDDITWSFEEIDLGEVISRTVQDLFPMAGDSGVEIDATGVQPGLRASADQDHLHQALTNVVGNAIKFGESGGRVEIRMHREIDRAVIEVQDWGEGIAGEDKQVVLERFRQVTHDSLTSKPEGTGLGLSIARDIVERHRGHIVVESEVGQGATFRISLPLLVESAGADA